MKKKQKQRKNVGSESVEETLNGKPPAGGEGPADKAGGPPPPQAAAMTGRVTRHGEITSGDDPASFKVISAGIDGLDIGFMVDWGLAGVGLREALENGRNEAKGSDGIIISLPNDSRCLTFPTSGKRRYRYRVQTPDFNAYLFKNVGGESTPDIYISLSSKKLWGGVRQAFDDALAWVEALGVTVRGHKISRCDICTDMIVPGGLTFDYVSRHRVPLKVKMRPFLDGDEMETIYIGAKDAPIQLRIYNKYKEIIIKNKLWFLTDVWGFSDLKEAENVWRFEYQLRRSAIKSYQIETIDDLLLKLAGVWADLSNNWFSLRALDDSNTTRRSVLHIWKAVQEAGVLLGEYLEIRRETRTVGKAELGWYLARIIMPIVGYAVCLGIDDLYKVVECLVEDVVAYLDSRFTNFKARYDAKAIKLGVDFNPPDDGIPF